MARLLGLESEHDVEHLSLGSIIGVGGRLRLGRYRALSGKSFGSYLSDRRVIYGLLLRRSFLLLAFQLFLPPAVAGGSALTGSALCRACRRSRLLCRHHYHTFAQKHRSLEAVFVNIGHLALNPYHSAATYRIEVAHHISYLCHIYFCFLELV